MRTLEPLEIGLMFWASASHTESDAGPFTELRSMGLHAGQLGLPGELLLPDNSRSWREALNVVDAALTTAVCSYPGESYADIAAVERTVGLVPAATRQQRIARTKAVSDFAASLQIPAVACHIGFVPHDRNGALYAEIVGVVRDICMHCWNHGQNFALETGQEPADVLLAFIQDVDRPNLKINFDPANLILYGTGDPLGALELLAPHIISVHCKDGDPPPSDAPGALGTERRLGDGQVNIPQFVGKLRELGYRGILSIEREEPDAEKRAADIRHGIRLLRQLTGRQI